MVKEVKNLTNIRLTESATDGIWLHFDGGDKKAGISLDELTARLRGGIIGSAIQAWAREQLDKQETAHRRFYLHPELDKDTLRELERLNNVIKNEPLPPAPANEFLKEGNEERTEKPGTRPSPPVDGGY